MQQSPYKAGHVKEITSAANPLIKQLRALNLKKYRDRSGLFIAEGLKLVWEGLEQGFEIDTLIYAPSTVKHTPEQFSKNRTRFSNENGTGGNKQNPLSERGQSTTALVEKLAARTVARGGLVIKSNNKIMASLTRRDNPQMVVGVFHQRWQKRETVLFEPNDVYVALDRVRDPGNLGTIIRTCDAVGAKGIFLIGDTSDPYSLEAVRATMGSIFAIDLFRLDETSFLQWQQNFAGWLVGTHLKGTKDYRQIQKQGKPLILLMGNEQQGLSEALSTHCHELVRIPQKGRADSLNLAVATAVMLYEIQRNML